MISPLRTLLLVLAVGLVSGCGLRLAYQQLDRLVPWYVSDYVTLDDQQRDALDSLLADRLAWHCETQIPAYRDWLDQVRSTLDRTHVGAAELVPLGNLAEALWRDLMLALTPDLGRMLAQLSDRQVDEVLRALDKKNRALRREHLDISAEKRLAKRTERMEKQLRRWTGRLSAEQHARLDAWAAALRPTTREWIAQREAWRLRFGEALALRADPPALEARLSRLLANPDANWPPSHRADLEFNRTLTLQLVADVHNLAPTRQRARIADEIAAMRAQLDALACGATEVALAAVR